MVVHKRCLLPQIELVGIACHKQHLEVRVCIRAKRTVSVPNTPGFSWSMTTRSSCSTVSRATAARQPELRAILLGYLTGQSIVA